MNIEIVLPNDFDSYSHARKETLCLSCYGLLEYMRKVGDIYNFHDRDKVELYISSKNKFSDESKQILNYLKKSKTSGVLRENVSNNINDKTCQKYLSICIDINNNTDNPYYISNKDELIALKCNCYEKKINKNNFIEYCNLIFDKLCYSKTIEQSLNSISKHIKTSKGKILKHLQVLSSEDFEIIKSRNNNFIDIGNALMQYKISCSVLNDRNSVPSYVFTDNNSHRSLVLECELHTKLDSNQDNCIRIYFHPGIKHFCDNKVLIGHIGKHL